MVSRDLGLVTSGKHYTLRKTLGHPKDEVEKKTTCGVVSSETCFIKGAVTDHIAKANHVVDREES